MSEDDDNKVDIMNTVKDLIGSTQRQFEDKIAEIQRASAEALEDTKKSLSDQNSEHKSIIESLKETVAKLTEQESKKTSVSIVQPPANIKPQQPNPTTQNPSENTNPVTTKVEENSPGKKPWWTKVL